MSITKNDSNPAVQSSEAEQDGVLNLLLNTWGIYIRPYLWLFIFSLILFSVGGVIYLQTTVPLYRSTCQLHIHNQDVQVVNFRGIDDPNFQSGATFLKTQMLILQSREILDRAQKLVGGSNSSLAACSAPEVKHVAGTLMVDLSISSTDPNSAAQMANTIAEVYLESVQKRKVNISFTGVNLLRDQLEEIRKNREEAVRELLSFKEKHGIFNLSENYSAIISQINALTNTATEARLEEMELATTLQSIRENRANAARLMPYLVPRGSDSSSNLGAIKMLYFTHQTNLPGLLAQYNEGHTAVQTHHKVSDLLQAAQESEVDLSIDGLKLRYDRAQKKAEMVVSQVEDLRHQLVALDQVAGDYEMRQATCDSLDNTYKSLVNRINEIKISNATTTSDTSSIFIVSPAIKAAQPFFPNPRNVFRNALALGLAIAAALAFILASINNKVTSIEEVNAMFANRLPVFGSIPLIDAPEQELLLSSGEDPVDETFRNIRTSLNLSMLTREHKTLAISSAIPREGKTFITLQLARSFARDKKKTLLMDLDLRKPRIQKILQEFLPPDASQRGLSNVLLGDCKLDEVVLELPEFGFAVALAGPVPPNPNELLSSGCLPELLQQAQAQYDLVLIDTAPIVPVSDTLIIASHDVPLLLCSRLFQLTRPVLRHLHSNLQQLKINLAGLIANNLDVPKNFYDRYSAYSYKYGYKYGYAYGYGSKKKVSSETKPT